MTSKEKARGRRRTRDRAEVSHKDSNASSVRRGRGDRLSDGRTPAVRAVHVRDGSDSPRRKRGVSGEDRGGDVRKGRADRGSKGPQTSKARKGTKRRSEVESGQFVDRDGKRLYQDAAVNFHSYTGPILRGKVVGTRIVGRMVEVLIGKDPFSTNIDHRQLELNESEKNAVTTKQQTRSPKELRLAAKELGIEGWREMGRDELAAAVRTAEGASADTKTRRTRKPSAKKAAAKKAPSKAAKTTKTAKTKKTSTRKAAASTNGDSPNPFRPGTNLWFITEELMKGGKRSKLVTKLLPKLQYSPRVKSESEFDPEIETDRRLKVVGYLLKNTYGWDYSHEGRGRDAVIKATPPA